MGLLFGFLVVVLSFVRPRIMRIALAAIAAFFAASAALSATSSTSHWQELAFDKPIKLRWSHVEGKSIERQFTTAIFRQKDKDKPNVHHDVLEMPDGQQILLTELSEGQNATVLQLPAAPKTEKEAEEQKRAEYVG
jgi:ABC-type glycerol-3-phosphate transport system substrate-binding protein